MNMKSNNLSFFPVPTPGIIRAHSGLMVNVFNPDPDTLLIEDIAHALSHLCRFGGHTQRFYSVAEHSIRCADYLSGRAVKLAALLHDASEAYLVDIPAPIKSALPEYLKIEDKLMKVIADKFGFRYPLPKAVDLVDKVMLHEEWENIVMDDFWWNTLSSQDAEYTFLEYFKRLA